jgi:hypothetical protein
LLFFKSKKSKTPGLKRIGHPKQRSLLYTVSGVKPRVAPTDGDGFSIEMNLMKTLPERNILENRVQKASVNVENPQCHFLRILKCETHCRTGIEGIGSPTETERNLAHLVFETSSTLLQILFPLIIAYYQFLAWKGLVKKGLKQVQLVSSTYHANMLPSRRLRSVDGVFFQNH